jgi:hypothetical protein
MTDKEAMAMALEMLECANSLNRDYENEIAALKERLAQKPVKYKCTVIDNQHPNGIPLEQWVKPPQRIEHNFCSRCGKRTPDLTHIHTCTPPKKNT